LAILGILAALFLGIRRLIGLAREKLLIKIYDDKIIYEYITDKGEKKRDVLKKEEIMGIFPLRSQRYPNMDVRN